MKLRRRSKQKPNLTKKKVNLRKQIMWTLEGDELGSFKCKYTVISWKSCKMRYKLFILKNAVGAKIILKLFLVAFFLDAFFTQKKVM